MLPDNYTPWPPPQWRAALDQMKLHAIWYGGNPLELANYYYQAALTPGDRGAFWAKAIAMDRRVSLHIPIAADLAQTSAAMLFGNHPRIRIAEAFGESPDAVAVKSQDHLEHLLSACDVWALLSEAAEFASALGGVYLKADWDPAVRKHAVLTVNQPDSAIPEFAFGRYLTAVTFWKTLLESDGKDIWRLLERREPGLIYQGLYRGNDDSLGVQVDLKTRQDTAKLQPVVQTGLESLACVYIPNNRPHRRFRGSGLGRSDQDNCESLMDSVDEAWTSLHRDVRLGQARLGVPATFLELDSASGSFGFNLDTEIYTPYNVPPDGTMKESITETQFDIRTAAHIEAIREYIARIVMTAGYAPQSFGQSIEGAAPSGVSLRIKERRSIQTTGRKADYWVPAIQQILFDLMSIDAKEFTAGVVPFAPSVEMMDSVVDVSETFTSIELLNRAEAASIRVKVGMAHPDWDEAEVESEALRIEDETGRNLTDPATLRVTPPETGGNNA